MSNIGKQALEESYVPVRIKLALLWASLMFLYIYNDYFSLYLPGVIEKMSSGRMGAFGEISALGFVAVSTMLAVPALMIFLSAALPPVHSRWLNVFLGLAYTIIEGLTLSRNVLFYQLVVGLEMIITFLIIWYALRWPRQPCGVRVSSSI